MAQGLIRVLVAPAARFSSLHPHGGSQSSTTAVPGDPAPSSHHPGPGHAHGKPSHVQASKTPTIHMKKMQSFPIKTQTLSSHVNQTPTISKALTKPKHVPLWELGE